MTPEQQNAFLLNLARRLYLELAVYRVYVEFGKLAAGEESVNRMLSEARQSAEIRTRVDSFFDGLTAALSVPGSIDPDQAVREFLAQLGQKQKPN